MGPKDADPASAVNVAQVGDCLTGASGQERRVPCTDPTATVQILQRVNDVSTTQVPTSLRPGARRQQRVLVDLGLRRRHRAGQASYQTDAVFCLGPSG